MAKYLISFPSEAMVSTEEEFPIVAPDRAAAVEWARKIAASCRCSQELREFMYDPAS